MGKKMAARLFGKIFPRVFSIFIILLMLDGVFAYPVLMQEGLDGQESTSSEGQQSDALLQDGAAGDAAGESDASGGTAAGAQEGTAAEGQKETAAAAVTSTGAKEPYCEADYSLLPEETQAILNLLKDGYVGREISSGTPKNEDREALEQSKIILTNPERQIGEPTAVKGEKKAEEALAIEQPKEKFEPWEMAHFLNNSISGPFAFGLVLDDSLRAGRCKSWDKTCALAGANLKYRNSGAGIKADFINVYDNFMELWDGNSELKNFSEEENDVLRAAFQGEDKNTFSMKVAKRLETALIPNSILTDQFEAKMSTNCTDDMCVLSTYSMFDKYFNSWMSAEMVASNFGPALLFSAKKMFGWVGRRGTFLRGTWNKFTDKFRQMFESPGSLISNVRMQRAQANIDRYGFRQFFDELTNPLAGADPNAPLALTAGFQGWWNKWSSPGGYLDSVKSLERRHEFIKIVKDWRSFIRAGEANTAMAEEAFAKAVKEYGAGSAVAREAYVDYGRQFARWLNQLDDAPIRLDAPYFVIRNPFTQLYNYGVKSVNSGDVVDLYYDPRHFRRILDKFVDDGDWTGFMGQVSKYQSAYETVPGTGWLQLYKFDVSKAERAYKVNLPDLDSFVGNLNEDLWVNTPQRGWIQLNSGSVDLVKSANMPQVELYRGGWVQAEALTPEALTGRLTNARTRNNIRIMGPNTDQMLDTLRERNWVGRRYWSALDKLMAQEDELIKSYFSVKGGIKWTVYPFGYWWAKKGFGIEGISEYQLPDTWKEITISHKDAAVYDDAYIDFFANEGSDQGDIFVQVLNRLPWKYVLDALSDQFNPVRGVYDALTKNEIRSEAEDLALYSTTAEECVGCTMTLSSKGLKDFSPFFVVDKPINNYILEDTRTEDAKKLGTTIITYSHHTNLKGETSGDNAVEGGKIDLVEAKQDEKTCGDALRKLFSESPMGIPFYDIDPKYWEKLGPATGGLLFGMESLSYGLFFWSGIFSSVAIQTLIAPKLQDCVDYDEGYFVHYFLPTKELKAKSGETTAELSTEKVNTVIKDLSDKFSSAFKGDEKGDDKSLTKQAVKESGKFIENLAGTAEADNIVQATLTLQGLSAGQLTGKKLFYFWCGEGCEMHASEYKTEGKAVVKDDKTGITTEFDFKTGQLMRDGKPIINADGLRPEFVRMADVFNANGPFQEIPQTLTITCLQASGKTAMEVYASGESKILDDELLRCIEDGVMAQTGLPMPSANLADTFGKATKVITTTHPVITTMGDRIIAEGVPRKLADGEGAKVIIQADRGVRLSKSNDNDPYVGILKSVQFEHGSIVVRDDGCFIVWLRHHAAAVLGQNDAKGLETSLTTSKNPETGCEEPALDFEVKPDPNSDYSESKVDKFNTSLEHMGPFQVFETPTKRYILYSGPAPECTPHLRIIDKETGEVIADYAISDIQETPTGLKFTTDDGKTHTLDFTVKDGVPTVQFDNEKPETLLAAQGRNGSFWYDPQKGLWYAENAQLLPLLEAFREGIATKAGADGTVTSTAAGNVLNLNLGEGSGFNLLDLPSLPEQPFWFALFIISVLSAMVAVRISITPAGRRGRTG